MRFARTYVLTFLSLLLTAPAFSQQTTTPTGQLSAQRDPQAIAVLQQSLAAMTGPMFATPINSFVLRGTVSQQLATSQESGTVQFECSSPAVCRLDLNSPSSNRTVVVNGNSGFELQDGITTNLPLHALVNHPLKFLPQFSELCLWQNDDYAISYVAQEKIGDVSVHHIHIERFLPAMSERMTTLYSQLSGVELYLDVNTLLLIKRTQQLPSSLDMSSTLPFEEYFSGYSTVGGILIATQISAFVGGQRYLDITFTEAQANPSLSLSDFQAVQ